MAKIEVGMIVRWTGQTGYIVTPKKDVPHRVLAKYDNNNEYKTQTWVLTDNITPEDYERVRANGRGYGGSHGRLSVALETELEIAGNNEDMLGLLRPMEELT